MIDQNALNRAREDLAVLPDWIATPAGPGQRCDVLTPRFTGAGKVEWSASMNAQTEPEPAAEIRGAACAAFSNLASDLHWAVTTIEELTTTVASTAVACANARTVAEFHAGLAAAADTRIAALVAALDAHGIPDPTLPDVNGAELAVPEPATVEAIPPNVPPVAAPNTRTRPSQSFPDYTGDVTGPPAHDDVNDMPIHTPGNPADATVNVQVPERTINVGTEPIVGGELTEVGPDDLLPGSPAG